MWSFLSIATIAALVTSAGAEETVVRDLRLVGGWAASNHDADGGPIDVGTGQQFGVMAIATAGRFGAIGGPVIGGEVSSLVATSGTIDVDRFDLTLHAGWAAALAHPRSVHIEGGVFGGLIRQTVEAGAEDDASWGTQYGVRAGAAWTLLGPFQIGADVRYLVASENDIELLGARRTISNRGLVGLLSLGLRL